MSICTVVVKMILYSFVGIDRLRLECKFDNETWHIGGWDRRFILVLTASSSSSHTIPTSILAQLLPILLSKEP